MQTTALSRSQEPSNEVVPRPIHGPRIVPTVDAEMANMVRQTALHLLRRLPSHINFDDLYSAGLFALVEAERRFDGARGISFRDYARHRVHGAMLDDLRRGDTISRQRRRKIRLGIDRDDAPPPPRLVGLIAAAAVADPGADPEDELARREALEKLRIAQTKLPERLRLVLRLRLLEGWRLQRIADHLGVTQGRACQLVAEAVGLLRSELEPPAR